MSQSLPALVSRAVGRNVTILRQGATPLVVALGRSREPAAALMDERTGSALPHIYPLALHWNGLHLARVAIGSPLSAGDGTADYGLGATGGFAYYATAVSGQFQTVSIVQGGAGRHWIFQLSSPASEVRFTPTGTRLWVAYKVQGNWRQGTLALNQVGPRSLSPALTAVAQPQNHNALFIRLVENVRHYFGNGIVADIENVYYNLADAVQRLYYHVTGQRASTPRLAVLPSQPATNASTSGQGLPANIQVPSNWPQAQGQGVWQSVGPLIGGHPAMEETFLHPDPDRPWATSYLVWINPAAVHLHYVAGLGEPVSASGVHGSGLLPTDPALASHVVAAFNSGFKSESTVFGAMADGEVLSPPVPGIATFAIYRDRQVALGAWGTRHVPLQRLWSYRQNLPLIVDHGQLSPLLGDPKAWGVVVGNSTYVWRSGLGITAAGDLVYAAGDPLSAFTLARTLKAAGAVRAMQLDINSYWVTFNFYHWVASGGSGYLLGTKLSPDLVRPANRYLTPDTRDFFYVTIP